MRTRLVLLAVCAAVLAAPAAAQADAFLPPGNKVFWGGIGGYDASNIRDFARPVRQAPGRVRLLHQVEGQPLRAPLDRLPLPVRHRRSAPA